MVVSKEMKRVFFVGALAVTLMVVMGGVFLRREIQAIRAQKADRMEVLGKLPDFSLVERSGEALGLADLKGKVWLAGFVFTHCAGPCPLISAQMSALQRPLAEFEDVRLVSFSVDPERDTPAVLSDYARRYEADPDRWLFLTGKKKDVYRLILEGFKVTVEDGADVMDIEGEDQIVHTLKLALVDRKGQIRAYYVGTEPELEAELIPDVRRLLAEEP
ncbi:MAG: SCO family protein [bacterium]|nr:SCO family protein [bacterium]